MNERELMSLAHEDTFNAIRLVPMDAVTFNASFLAYCEQNLCGQYGANYSCPPDCGTPDQMAARLKRFSHALVFQSKWDIDDWYDPAQIRHAKRTHNAAMLRAIERMKQVGLDGVMAGASCCNLCDRCARVDGAPCAFPETRFSCMSAYCIYVKALADTCGMEYACADGRLAFFGLYALSPDAAQTP